MRLRMSDAQARASAPPAAPAAPAAPAPAAGAPAFQAAAYSLFLDTMDSTWRMG